MPKKYIIDNEVSRHNYLYYSIKNTDSLFVLDGSDPKCTVMMARNIDNSDLKKICKYFKIKITQRDFISANLWSFHKVQCDWKAFNKKYYFSLESDYLLDLEDELKIYSTKLLNKMVARRKNGNRNNKGKR